MIRAELDASGKVVIDAPFAQKELVKEIPGTVWRKDTGWTAPLSWATCHALRGQFGDQLEIGPALRAWALEEYDSWVGRCLRLRELLEPLDSSSVRSDGLFPFQSVAREMAVLAESSLNASEMGTGKTVVGVKFIEESPFQALVICPNSVKSSWRRAFETWAPHLHVQVLEGGAAQRRKALALKDETDVYITNWESLRGFSRLAPYGGVRLNRCEACGGTPDVSERACEAHPRELNGGWIRTVVADEAHKAKDPKAKQTRALWALGDEAMHRLALTGTPVINSPDDLWSIMRFVSPADFPARTKFLDRYCVRSWNTWGGMEVLGLRPDTRDELFKIVYPRYIRQLKAAVLPQLPPKLYETREVELTGKQKKAYDALVEDMIAEVDDGILAVTSPLVLAGRLGQMASAYGAIDIEGHLKLTEPSSKLDELMELLQNDLKDEPVVVFAESRQLLELAEVRLTKAEITHASVTGAVTGAAREKALMDFEQRKVRVLMLTSGAGGEGLTLTTARVLVRLQRSWSPAKNLQVEDRIHRIGQTAANALIIDIVTKDTVEEGQLRTLEGKHEMSEEFTLDRETLLRFLT